MSLGRAVFLCGTVHAKFHVIQCSFLPLRPLLKQFSQSCSVFANGVPDLIMWYCAAFFYHNTPPGVCLSTPLSAKLCDTVLMSKFLLQFLSFGRFLSYIGWTLQNCSLYCECYYYPSMPSYLGLSLAKVLTTTNATRLEQN